MYFRHFLQKPRAAVSATLWGIERLSILAICAVAGCSASPRPTSPTPTRAPCPVPRGFIQGAGGAIHVQQHGAHNSDRAVVVLVHDWAHDGSVFYEQAAALRTRYAVVTYDLRGHGVSADDAGKGADVAGHALDLMKVIEVVAHDHAPVHLVGLGLGGLISLDVAENHPDTVRSLTLISTSSALSEQVRQRYLTLVENLNSDPQSYGDWSGRLLPVWFDGAYLNRRPDALAQFDTMFDRHDPRSVAGTLERIVDHHVDPNGLARIRVPTLVIYGERDALPSTVESEKQFGALPHVTRIRIPEAKHEPQLENPAAVNAALARHLGSS